MNRDKFLTRSDIEHLISQGHIIVIYNEWAIKMDNWVKNHPGGDTAVYHLVGRDATDEMNAYHSDETVSAFKKWRIGTVEKKWINFQPPIRGGKFRSYEEQKKEEKSCLVSADSPNGLSSSSSVSSISEPDESRANDIKIDLQQRLLVDEHGIAVKTEKITPIEIAKVHKSPQQVIDDYDNALVEYDYKTLPSVDYDTQKLISDKYRELHEEVKRRGFYKCNYWAYFRELCRISSLFMYSAVFLKLGYITLSAFFMGCAWQQMTFIAHDAGHVAITHNYQFDNLFGILIADFFGGLSVGWWKRNHNVHHIITNDPVNDPDIQHLPFFAVSTKLFGDVYSTYYEKVLKYDALAKFLIPIQNYTYYPILCFGRFNLYRLSWQHILQGLGPRHGKAAWFRYWEFVGLSFFFYWYFYLLMFTCLDNWRDRFVHLMVSHITTMVVHVQITLSHFAMSTSELGEQESFPQRQSRTTMDVDCPEWFDYIHGGLQFQLIHHYFPRVPRHNLRALQPLLEDFCKEVGLHYSIYKFVKGNKIVIGKLGEIGQQAKVLAECTKFMGKEGISYF